MRTDNLGWSDRLSLYSWDVVNGDVRALSKKFARWANLESERGVTAIEYGLIAALVAVAIIVAVRALGTSLNTTFGSVSSAL